jgi:hypothetical protein
VGFGGRPTARSARFGDLRALADWCTARIVSTRGAPARLVRPRYPGDTVTVPVSGVSVEELPT